VGEGVEHDGAAHDGGPVLGHHGRVQLLAVQQLQCNAMHGSARREKEKKTELDAKKGEE